jgi:hypothetical protein
MTNTLLEALISEPIRRAKEQLNMMGITAYKMETPEDIRNAGDLAMWYPHTNCDSPECPDRWIQ